METNLGKSTGISQEMTQLSISNPSVANENNVSLVLDGNVIKSKKTKCNNNDNLLKIKNKLINSFSDKIDLRIIKNDEINYNSLENIIK